MAAATAAGSSGLAVSPQPDSTTMRAASLDGDATTKDGASHSQNRIELAGHHHPFESTADGHNMYVASQHYVGNLFDRPKWQKTNIRWN